MKTFALLLAGTAGVAAASPAMAQTLQNTAFTGPRAEAMVGYDSTTAGSDVDNDLNDNDDQSADGFLYGGAIGYDFAFGGVLVGAEGEITGSTAKTDFDRFDAENFGLGRVEAGRDLYVGLRAGVLARPDTLVYVKGGYSNARFNALASDGETELDTNFTLDGYRLGLGVEHALSERTFAKIEGRYSNYENANITFDNSDFDGYDADIDADRFQIVVSYGVRF